MATLEFFVHDRVEMAPGPWPNDTTNGISKLILDSVGDVFMGGCWGGPTRKMEVSLSVPDDLIAEYRDRLQAALDAGTITPSGIQKPTVKIQIKRAGNRDLSLCSCGDD